jgi:predicted nucleic acid-binding protein
MSEDVLPQRSAWAVYDRLTSDERIFFASEPAGVEAMWRELSSLAHRRTSHWTDAYLAACALAGSLRFVSFDAGFGSLRGLRALLLRCRTTALGRGVSRSALRRGL